MALSDKELIAEFVIESQEGLANIESQMLAIETAGANIDAELVNAVFRTMHSIKGTAGFLGLDQIGLLAHGLEETLNNLRNREVIPTPDLVTAVLKAADFMKKLLDTAECSGEGDVEPYVAALQQFCPHAADNARETNSQPLSAFETDLDASMAAVAPTLAARTGANDSTRLGDLLVHQGKIERQQLDEALQQQRRGDPLLLGEILVERGLVQTQDIRDAITSLQETKTLPVSDTTIRVDVALLDKLMTRVGELVLARNQILQYTGTMDDAGFISTAQRLNLITTELQEGVMKTRMQPIGNVWSKFPRVVRDLASLLGKQVRIEMEGKETELDKTIVEAIKDPLTHLVRNAIDHGIESPQMRSAAGKPGEGRLSLRAFHEGGQVNIEISDDGAGLNIDRIRRRAVERGVVSAHKAATLSDSEAAQLIMLPGFSTAEQVTSVSGRGVGMDVVKTNIERIGGMIDLQSQPGQGTTVRIKIPLTLAIIPALIVTNDGDRYAIPQASLLELVRLEGEQVQRSIEFVHGAPVYRLRGKLLPLVNLSERLGLQPSRTGLEASAAETSADRVVNIVVLRANDRQFGLVVDKVNDTEEIVVKPLSRQLKRLSEYAGATIMGDGTVALILDVIGLATAAGLAGKIRDQALSATSAGDARNAEQSTSLLIVDLGDARRFALPTSMVSRLEKAQRSSIEYADGREVIQYRGDILPLVRLADVFGAGSVESTRADELQIVVYSEQGNRYGLVVSRIIDVVETEVRFSAPQRDDDNLLGTTVIQQRVTDVVNLPHLARQTSRRNSQPFIAV